MVCVSVTSFIECVPIVPPGIEQAASIISSERIISLEESLRIFPFSVLMQVAYGLNEKLQVRIQDHTHYCSSIQTNSLE